MKTGLTEKLGIEHPIIQAPMGGGASTVEMAIAASEAGAFGFLAAAYLTPEQIEESAKQIREKTDKPFGINLFAPVEPGEVHDKSRPVQFIAPYYEELKLPQPEFPQLPTDNFEAKFEAALESGASVFSFTFGIPSAAYIEAIKAKGMLAVATATTVQEAILVEQAGFEAVVMQGSEAGGHRGTFAAPFAEALIGTMALVPQAADAVQIPVIASGGVMDGRGILASLILGADAVQMGTVFLTTREAGISDAHKDAILNAKDYQTKVTQAFSGRPARGIINRFMAEAEENPENILPFPYQNRLTRAMRREAARQNKADYLSLWAGQGLTMAKKQSVAELINRLVEEIESSKNRFNV